MISKRPGLGEVAHESRTGQNPTFGRIPISFEQEWVKNRFSDISYYGLKYSSSFFGHIYLLDGH